ncbi:MAG: helix-turn-helix transcriptional regulator [Firmicutes bacterium]|nr:helix-turn-helix transcriptional regulator [Bacillota bacterium]
MKIDKNLREDNILKEIAQRLKQHRISYPMTRAELAEKSMVSVSTVTRFENGEDISFLKVIRILKALELENNLNELIPDYSEKPSFYVDKGVNKQRARRKNTKKNDWKWGDEQ